MQELDKAKGKRVEELLGVLWAYRTTKHILTSGTPFLLAYGIYAIVLVNVYVRTLRTEEIYWDHNAAQLRLAQDQSEERRQQALIRIVAYQQQINATHHKKVKAYKFQFGDLVLKRVIQSTKEKNVRKLEPNWEGPYTVVARGDNGSYTLAD